MYNKNAVENMVLVCTDAVKGWKTMSIHRKAETVADMLMFFDDTEVPLDYITGVIKSKKSKEWEDLAKEEFGESQVIDIDVITHSENYLDIVCRYEELIDEVPHFLDLERSEQVECIVEDLEIQNEVFVTEQEVNDVLDFYQQI